MSKVWEDPRIARGMERQLRWRQERIDGGETAIGWKVAFGSREAMANLGISAPLVGFLMDSARLDDGATWPLAGTTKAAIEPEIAVHMGRDLPAGAGRDETAAAIAALGPALELADLDRPLDELEDVIAQDIFQRAVVLGPPDTGRAGGSADALRARLRRDGETVAETDDPAATNGDLLDVIAHVAAFTEAFGARLRAGDVVITGTVVPLVWLDGPARFDYDLEPLGSLSVTITKE